MTPPTTTNTWMPRAVERPAASSLPNESRQATAVAHAALDHHGIKSQQGHDAGEPQLFAERRHDEVGFGEGDEVGMSLTEPDAQHAAAGEAVQALGDLEPVTGLVGERVEPDADAQLHVVEELVGDEGSRGEEEAADQDPGPAFCGDVEHGDEEPEEEQRGAEVPLEYEDSERPPMRRGWGRGRDRAEGRSPSPCCVPVQVRHASRRGNPRRR